MAAERDEELVLAPHPGPQTRLLESTATLTFYGGQGGGGKTYGALLALARWFQVSGYEAILFRRNAVDLEGADSAWEQSKRVMGVLGGTARTAPALSWRWPEHRSSIEMRHLQNPGDEERHQGKSYACVVFEEVTHFLASQFWYLISRLRSTCGVTPHMIATLNPDPESWVFALVEWWIDAESGLPIPERDGVVRWMVRLADDSLAWADTREELESRYPDRAPMSVTFIAARFSDNPTLALKDPDYHARLDMLPAVQRDRLKEGRWTRARKGSLFHEAPATYTARPIRFDVIRIGVDFAYSARTSADHNAAVVVGRIADRFYVLHVVKRQCDANAWGGELAALKQRYPTATFHAYIAGTELGVVSMLAQPPHRIRIDATTTRMDKLARAQRTAGHWNGNERDVIEAEARVAAGDRIATVPPRIPKRVYVPEQAGWDVAGFVDRVLAFTGRDGGEDDEIDALVAAVDAAGSIRVVTETQANDESMRVGAGESSGFTF